MSDPVILDSSAVLAVLFNEPGGNIVTDRLGEALISTVNLSEAVAKLVERGAEIEFARALLDDFDAERVAFTDEDAYVSGGLRNLTKPFGLSFGDRACLSLAMQRRCPVLTADRAFSKLDIDIEIEMIR